MHRFLIVLALLLPLQAFAAGFERVMVPGPAPIAAGIWYPTGAEPGTEPNTPFRQALALGAPLAGDGLPVVILSHGDGGWMGGHADTALALAEAGYVAVALEHPGNNSEDESAAPAEWLVSRPRDVSAVLDFVLTDWRFADRVDPGRIGVFGFSAGGYTALVAAGAVPDFERAAAHCAMMPGEFVCKIGMLDGVGDPDMPAADERIGAISIAAPGLGFAFDAEALAGVGVPVQLWSGEVDDRVPHPSNGAVIARGLPGGADVHVVKDAGHFAFMAECNPRLEEANPRIWQMVCVDAPGFDRGAFHRAFNAEVIGFFDRALERR